MEKFNIARVDSDFQTTDLMLDELDVIKDQKDVSLLRLVCNSEEDIIEKAADVDVIVTHTAFITDRVMKNLPRLKAVVRYGVGYDTVDVGAATQNGVVVINVPDFCDEEVSNHILMFLLTYAKKIIPLNSMTKDGKWAEAKAIQEPMRCLHGETLGIIGCGNLGRNVARKAKALDMKVIGYDKYLPKEIGEKAGIEMVSLEELVERSDYITLHLVLTEETKHFVNKELLSKMKKNCVLLNASRGPVVDEAALYEAITSGTIEGACLDVFEQEPVDPDNPLLKLDQVIVTPHDASYSDKAFQRLRRSVMQEALRIKDGTMPLHVVNKVVLDHARQPLSAK